MTSLPLPSIPIWNLNLISTILFCSSHRNDHRTSSVDCDLHKLMNTILCQLRNLNDLLSLSPLIIINNILSVVLSTIAFYLTFYVVLLLHRIVLYSVCMYRIVAIQPFGCNTTIKFIHSFIRFHSHSYTATQPRRLCVHEACAAPQLTVWDRLNTASQRTIRWIWQHAKKLNVNWKKNDNQVILLYMFTFFHTLQRLNSHSHTSYSHSRPILIPWLMVFPFLWESHWIPVFPIPTIRYDIRYDKWFALENWQASCQINLAHELEEN